MLSLNHSAQFVGLTGFTYEVYNLTVIQPVAPILEYIRESVNVPEVVNHLD